MLSGPISHRHDHESEKLAVGEDYNAGKNKFAQQRGVAVLIINSYTSISYHSA